MTSFRDIFVIATYLKKSFRQKSLASREKHFSDSELPQSEHWTHFECQGLSRTFSKKRSVIGLLQPAHSTIFLYSPSLLNGVAREISFQKNHRSFQVAVTISMCHCRLRPNLAWHAVGVLMDIRCFSPDIGVQPYRNRTAISVTIYATRVRCLYTGNSWGESRDYDRTVTIARLGDIVNRRPVAFGWRQL